MKIEEVSSCPVVPKVDPRVLRTRKLLKDALVALMSERAFQEITVADITERATLNRATFYAHFEDKAHLASSMLCEELHDSLIASLNPPTPFGPESLTALTVGMFEFVGRTRSGCRNDSDDFFASAVGPKLQETLEKLLIVWLGHQREAAHYFSGATHGTAASVFSWSIYGGAVRWSRLSNRPASSVAARETVMLLLHEANPSTVTPIKT